MSDYISREAALAFQDELAVLLCKDVVTGDVMSATKDADLVKYLLSIPAADVRPVVRGKWIGTHDGFYYSYSCSECGYEALYKENTKDQVCSELCPNCGADMSEEN